MSNQLRMAQIQAITALLAQGWSQRRIARELGVHRETVARYAKRLQDLAAKPANLRPGSDPGTDPPTESTEPKPATLHSGVEPAAEAQDPLLAGLPNGELMTPRDASASGASAGEHSACWPFREAIQQKVDQALSAQRIWQDLRAEHGFTASYYSVLRFVAKLRPASDLPFRRLECVPGAEAQVDFGTGAAIALADGKRQRTHVFRIVLSHSRKAYSEAVTRQTTDAFLACLENAFHHFGGVPKTLVIDNLKAAVTKADWFDPDINPKMLSFCEHYGIALLPTKPYTPRHKGKVERGIDYVQENALKGRVFASLQEQNEFLLDWECHTADTRIHGTTRRQVGAVFTQVEKQALGPLPMERFANFQEGRRTVHRDGHVEIGQAYYSVPPEYLSHIVWVRWDHRMVRVFNQRLELIATHIRRGPGGFSTLDAHLHSAKISAVERGAQELIDRAKRLGPSIGQWAEALHQQRGVTGVRPILGLLGLIKKFPVAILDDACAAAHRHGAYRLRTVRQLAQNRLDASVEQAELLDAHPLIRPLTEYSQILSGQLLHGGVGGVVTVSAWDAVLGAGEPAAPVSPAPKPSPPPSLFPVPANNDYDLFPAT